MANIKLYIEKTEKLLGGLADNKTLKDIAKKHDVKLSYLIKQYHKGINVESEHTSDKTVASEITKDHLFEDPKYYIKLSKIEEVFNNNSDLSVLLKNLKNLNDYYNHLNKLLSTIYNELDDRFDNTNIDTDELIDYIMKQYNLTENLLPEDVLNIINTLKEK